LYAVLRNELLMWENVLLDSFTYRQI